MPPASPHPSPTSFASSLHYSYSSSSPSSTPGRRRRRLPSSTQQQPSRYHHHVVETEFPVDEAAAYAEYGECHHHLHPSGSNNNNYHSPQRAVEQENIDHYPEYPDNDAVVILEEASDEVFHHGHNNDVVEEEEDDTDSYIPSERDIWDGASPKSVVPPPEVQNERTSGRKGKSTQRKNARPQSRRSNPSNREIVYDGDGGSSINSSSSHPREERGPAGDDRYQPQQPQQSMIETESPAWEDVLVHTNDNLVCWHSSQILGYASPTLFGHLQLHRSSEETGQGTYTLAINAPQAEWQLMASFLEPHSRQTVHVTPQNLPTLLPWFRDLQLHVLLQECDSILASMNFGSAGGRNPTDQDVADVLLLLSIAQACQDPLGATALTRTFHASLRKLDSWLAKRPGLFTSLDDVMTITELLHHAQARERLWRTVLPYLPPDLPLRQVEGSIVHNHLFPYLLREGIRKAAKSKSRARRLPPQNANPAPASFFASTPQPTSDSFLDFNNHSTLEADDDDSAVGSLLQNLSLDESCPSHISTASSHRDAINPAQTHLREQLSRGSSSSANHSFDDEPASGSIGSSFLEEPAPAQSVFPFASWWSESATTAGAPSSCPTATPPPSLGVNPCPAQSTAASYCSVSNATAATARSSPATNAKAVDTSSSSLRPPSRSSSSNNLFVPAKHRRQWLESIRDRLWNVHVLAHNPDAQAAGGAANHYPNAPMAVGHQGVPGATQQPPLHRTFAC